MTKGETAAKGGKAKHAGDKHAGKSPRRRARRPAPTVAARLVEARHRLGLSRRALAERLGIGERELAELERGAVAPDSKAVAAYGDLGIDLNWLLLGIAPNPPKPVAVATRGHSLSPYPRPPAPSDSQLRSRSYVLPAQDTEFLLRDELRAMRFALEYEKAELLLRDAGIRSTIVVFGSARVLPREETERQLAIARSAAERAVARRRLRQSVYYEEARAFGRIVSQRGGALKVDHRLHDNVIATGGGPGVMEAACRGAAEVGAPSIGFNISLPMEQEPNRYTTPNLTFQFHYFAMRKMHLAMRANALAVFPGGFGTMDEMFEILTLQQTGKAPAIPVVLFGRRYWRQVINFHALYEADMVSLQDLALFEMVDTAEEAWESFLRRGLKAHTPAEAMPRPRHGRQSSTRGG